MSTSSSTSTAAQTFGIDPIHSSVEFTVRHLMISKVRGRFAGVSGTVEVGEGSDLPTSVVATIQTATVATGDPQRDGHLASPDFFDAAQFPTIEFRSTNISGATAEFE
ncbi:MAG: YceI family protein, partial [Candidatus Eremiobacteraeota bacterium]|nr:YceI family protein [Candidatus Eremiobacteraeota bacterium]